MSEQKWYRQGEILINKMEKSLSKEDMNKYKDNGVIREGEATGHLHKLDENAELYENEKGVMFFIVKDKSAVLSHPEHAPIAFPKGDYRVTIQREYDELGNKYIAD